MREASWAYERLCVSECPLTMYVCTYANMHICGESLVALKCVCVILCVTGHGAQFRICGMAHHSVPLQGHWSRTAPSHMAGVPGLLAGQSHLDQNKHTVAASLEIEALGCNANGWSFCNFEFWDFTEFLSSHTFPLEAKRPTRVLCFKDASRKYWRLEGGK